MGILPGPCEPVGLPPLILPLADLDRLTTLHSDITVGITAALALGYLFYTMLKCGTCFGQRRCQFHNHRITKDQVYECTPRTVLVRVTGDMYVTGENVSV